MILLWEGVENFSVELNFQKSRKALELQLAQEYINHKKVGGPAERLLEYVHNDLAVFSPMNDYLINPVVVNAEELLNRWLKLYKSVHPEWRPYISARVRYMLHDGEVRKNVKTYFITGPLAESLRKFRYSEFIVINPGELIAEVTKIKTEAAGYSPAAFIHQQAKALTRAFTYLGKLMHV